MPAAGQGEKRVALVIGNSLYTVATKLPNAANDAVAMAGALARLGFVGATPVLDADWNVLDAAFSAFSEAAKDADVALIYYAGHSIQADGANYLLSVDANIVGRRSLERFGFELEGVLGPIKNAAKTSLVLLDGCRDNPFGKNFVIKDDGTRGVIVQRAGPATIDVASGDVGVFFATSPGQTAADHYQGTSGRSDHSPFTSALLDNIAAPGVGIETVAKRVIAAVRTTTGEKQRPWLLSSLSRELVLNPVADQPPTPKPDPAPAPAPEPDPEPKPQLRPELAPEPRQQPKPRAAIEPQPVLQKQPAGGGAAMSSRNATLVVVGAMLAGLVLSVGYLWLNWDTPDAKLDEKIATGSKDAQPDAHAASPDVALADEPASMVGLLDHQDGGRADAAAQVIGKTLSRPGPPSAGALATAIALGRMANEPSLGALSDAGRKRVLDSLAKVPEQTWSLPEWRAARGYARRALADFAASSYAPRSVPAQLWRLGRPQDCGSKPCMVYPQDSFTNAADFNVMDQGLRRLSWAVQARDREANAAGLSEVRYGSDGNADAAWLLAGDLVALGYPASTSAKKISGGGGNLEIWEGVRPVTWASAKPTAAWCYQQDTGKGGADAYLVACHAAKDTCKQALQNAPSDKSTGCWFLGDIPDGALKPNSGGFLNSWFQYSATPIGDPFPSLALNKP